MSDQAAKYDCAFLVYTPLRQRRADNSFDGNDNIGAKVIADTLTRAGLNVGYVTPESAHTVPLVMVSLTSTYDVYALLEAVALRPEWQPGQRKFKVIAGGFGMQNPTAIREYIDYSCFGRAHPWIVGVVNDVLAGRIPGHESLMDMKSMNTVKIAQADMYPHEVEGHKETFTGCPNKCKFCHYTFAREHTTLATEKDIYSQSTLTGGGSPEMMYKSLLTLDHKLGRVRVAIDGLSERLRYAYGKRISNQDIINGINQVGSYGPKASTMMVYNVCNFPRETEADYQEFVETVSQADPSHRVIFVLHSTPFRPSLATPMQWEQVNLLPDWSQRRTAVIVDRPNLRVVHSFTLETPWSHLRSVVVERATKGDDKAIRAIVFSPKLKAARADKALRLFGRNFDPAKWTREFDPEKESPASFLEGPVKNQQLVKMAVKMRGLF